MVRNLYKHRLINYLTMTKAHFVEDDTNARMKIKLIHFERKGLYLCNSVRVVREEQITKDKNLVTCASCLRKMRNMKI